MYTKDKVKELKDLGKLMEGSDPIVLASMVARKIQEYAPPVQHWFWQSVIEGIWEGDEREPLEWKEPIISKGDDADNFFLAELVMPHSPRLVRLVKAKDTNAAKELAETHFESAGLDLSHSGSCVLTVFETIKST